MAPKITVLLADDHALVRRGFRRMLEDDPGIAVVGEASAGKEAVRVALELRPKGTVMDCALPDISGNDAMRGVSAQFPGAGVPMVSMSSGEEPSPQPLEGGAR